MLKESVGQIFNNRKKVFSYKSFDLTCMTTYGQQHKLFYRVVQTA
jgi:hypothetical protein